MAPLLNLDGRVALVTGAGGGIGRAVAVQLAERRCHLALTDVNAEGLAQTEDLVAPHRVKVSRHVFDVADRGAVAALPGIVASAHGRLDILVNNAGVALGGTFEEVSEADFDWLMSINFFGVVGMTRAFLPTLHRSDDARIVNLSSIFGMIAPPGQTAYVASKFAVRGFSEALRHELKGTSVGVTVVHPGGIATSIAKDARGPAGVDAAELAARKRDFERSLVMPPERAGAVIVRAVEQRRPRILVGRDAQFAAALERLLPTTYWNVIERGRQRRERKGAAA